MATSHDTDNDGQFGHGIGNLKPSPDKHGEDLNDAARWLTDFLCLEGNRATLAGAAVEYLRDRFTPSHAPLKHLGTFLGFKVYEDPTLKEGEFRLQNDGQLTNEMLELEKRFMPSTTPSNLECPGCGNKIGTVADHESWCAIGGMQPNQSGLIDGVQFDKSDPHTRLFIAANYWREKHDLLRASMPSATLPTHCASNSPTPRADAVILGDWEFWPTENGKACDKTDYDALAAVARQFERELREVQDKLIDLNEDYLEVHSLLPSAPSATPSKWLVRAGGDNYDTWLCATREAVRNAFCEALYGDVESAEADDIDGYMKDFDRPWEDKEMRWSFEDGWLEVIALNNRADGGVKAP